MPEGPSQQSDLSKEAKAALLSAQRSAELCQACGICCNGSLFSFVDINETEAEALQDSPVKVLVNRKGKPVFGLPCSALSGSCCSIYEKRPRVCRSYLCALTRQVLNEGVEYSEALGVVTDIKERRLWLLENAPTELLKPQLSAAGNKKQSTHSIFSAWKISKSEDVKNSEPILPVPRGLWLLLSKLHPCLAKKQNHNELTTKDKEFIARAFAYAKICDRLFEKTSLLRKYGELVQRF
ncbi:MAG: YkgJ family cysteine cluster protein [Kordiimonas sp.]